MKEDKAVKGIDWSLTQSDEGELGIVDTIVNGGKAKVRALLLAVLSLSSIVWVMYRAIYGAITTRVDLSIFASMILLYVYISFPLGRKSWKDKFNWFFVIDATSILIILASETLIIYDELFQDTTWLGISLFGQTFLLDNIASVLLILVLIEACRRTMGWVVALLPVPFIIYALFSSHFPGPLAGASVSWHYLANEMFKETGGLWGIGVQVFINMVFLFLVFGSLLTQTKAGAVLISMALSLFGRQSGGPAKVAVVSSGAMAMISGSSVANVATTGTITIPMMKKTGYSPVDAAAIEAVASNGGQFTPPIMGATAFLISFFLAIPYANLAVYAGVPAFLYFVSLYFVVHFIAKRSGLRGESKEVLPSFWVVIAEGWPMIIPLLIFLYFLFRGYSVTYVGFVGVTAVIALSFIKRETRSGPIGILRMLTKAMRAAAPITTLGIALGVLIGVVGISGIGYKITTLVVTLSGGNVFIALIISAIIAILLGTGMPATLVYVTMLLFVIPALVDMGVQPLAAHLFCFHFGLVSGITPPVCVTSYTAASVARTSMWKTGFRAVRIGFASYIIPFVFVLNPGILISGSPNVSITVVSILSSTAAIIIFAAAVEGYFFKKMDKIGRILGFIAALCLIFPAVYTYGWIVKLAGLAVMAVLLVLQRMGYNQVSYELSGDSSR